MIATSQDKNIYTMELHESTWINSIMMTVTRVHNGWIYSMWNNETQESHSPIFIPFN